MRSRICTLTLGLIFLLGWSGPASGQTCPEGRDPRPGLGIGIFHCQSGTCVVGTATATMQSPGDRPLAVPRTREGPRYDFSSEPRLWGIDDDGPAAGRVHDGDVLVAVNGVPVTTREAGLQLTRMRPGEPIRLTVRRGGRLVEATVRPELTCDPLRVSAGSDPHPPSFDEDETRAPLPSRRPAGRGDGSTAAATVIGPLGMTLTGEQVVEVGPDGEVRWWFADPPVVLEVESDGPADRAGIPVGALLLRADDEPLTSPEGAALLSRPPGARALHFRIRVEGEERTVTVPQAGEAR